MVYIPAAEKRKLAGEERIVPGIISPPTQQKTERFQAKQPQFIILMTIVKGKAKKSFWTGLTNNEAASVKEIALRPVSVPWAFRECLCPFFSCPKGLPFCLLSWCYPCAVCLSDACNLPSQCCGIAPPSSWGAGNLSPPQWCGNAQQALHSSSCSHSCASLSGRVWALSSSNPSRRGDISTLMVTVAQGEIPWPVTQEVMVWRSSLQPRFVHIKAAKFNGAPRVAEELRSEPMLYNGQAEKRAIGPDSTQSNHGLILRIYVQKLKLAKTGKKHSLLKKPPNKKNQNRNQIQTQTGPAASWGSAKGWTTILQHSNLSTLGNMITRPWLTSTLSVVKEVQHCFFFSPEGSH